jgi:hypothetical protein
LYTLLSDVTAVSTAGGEITLAGDVTIALTKTAELEFNNKDGFSAFSEEKTVEANGVVNNVPTVVVEFPKMTTAKRLELDNITVAGLELVIWVQTAADTYHAIGLDYGAYCSLVSGTSGTGRSEKNMYQVTFTGEEDSLSYTMTAASWATVVTSLV